MFPVQINYLRNVKEEAEDRPVHGQYLKEKPKHESDLDLASLRNIDYDWQFISIMRLTLWVSKHIIITCCLKYAKNIVAKCC